MQETLLLVFFICMCFTHGVEKNIAKIRIAGENAFANHDWKVAEDMFSQLISHEPENPRNYYQRFRVYLSERKYLKAIGDLDTAIKVNPDYTQGLTQRAHLYIVLGDCIAAGVDYDKVLSLDPNSVSAGKGRPRASECEALLQKAETHQAHGQYPEAHEALTSVVENYATSSHTLLMDLAQLSVSMDNIFDAIADSGRALKLDSGNLDALQFRGQLFYQLGDADSLDAAIQHYRSALHSDPEHRIIKAQYRKTKSLVKLMKRIQESMSKKEYEDAVTALNKGLKTDPDHATVNAAFQLQLCMCYVALRKATESLHACRLAVTMNPEVATALAQLGEAQLLSENFQAAVNAYNKAQEMDGADEEIKKGVRKAQVALKQSKSKNYYKILGIPRHANAKEIKKGYRTKALQWHPDKHADADEEQQEKVQKMFHDIAEAYEILTDNNMKARYDRGEDVTGNPQTQQRRNPFHQHRGGQNFHFNF